MCHLRMGDNKAYTEATIDIGQKNNEQDIFHQNLMEKMSEY